MASSAPSTNETPLVSIICPVFNEEDCIPLFFSRLEESCGRSEIATASN
jgi:hypothetical protein